MVRSKSFFLIPAVALMAGCSVGPNYQRPAPAVALPMDWHWQRAVPQDDAIKGPWWEAFHNAELSQLEAQAVANNQDLKAAISNVQIARAQARLTGASFFPEVTFDPSYSRTQAPKDIPEFSKTPFSTEIPRTEPYNSFTVPVDLSYEIDLWGRVRRSFTAAQEQAQASVADYQNVLLTLTGDVAIDYFTLCEADEEISIVQDSIKFRADAVEINQKRVQAGRATAVDVAQAQTDLSNAQASLAQLQQNRAETQNALAFLCGTNATGFIESPHGSISKNPPLIPAGVPASLLERRPDIAEAERTMAAKNEQIGVAYAAFFPSVTLTGQDGFMSAKASDLFDWKNSIWSIGPAVRLPLFLGGENEANLQSARANYDKSVAQYRSTVLGAVRDVQNALSDLHYLRKQVAALEQSVKSADDAVRLSQERFGVGEVTYTDVVVTDETRLGTERNLVQARGQLYYATVRLIKALGGGWNAQALEIQKPPPLVPDHTPL